MKWIFSLILMISLHVQAEVTEATVSSGSATAEAAVTSPAADEIQVSVPEQKSDSAQVGIKNLKETDIPVQLDTAKKADSHESPFFRILLSFIVVGILGCASFFLLRKYRFSNNSQSQATQIKVLSQHYLGPKKSLAIVRVAGESVLIGITDQNISMIKSLSLLDEDIPEDTPKEFQTVFNRKTKAQDDFDEEQSAPTEARDEFSISGIKDFVSVKLKNMRSFE